MSVEMIAKIANDYIGKIAALKAELKTVTAQRDIATEALEAVKIKTSCDITSVVVTIALDKIKAENKQ